MVKFHSFWWLSSIPFYLYLPCSLLRALQISFCSNIPETPLVLLTNTSMLPNGNQSGYFSTSISFFFIFFSFYSLTHGIWKFLGRGSNLSCSCRPTPQPQQHQIQAISVTCAVACCNTRSLTCWTRPGIKLASLWTLCWVLNLLSHGENSSTYLYFWHSQSLPPFFTWILGRDPFPVLLLWYFLSCSSSSPSPATHRHDIYLRQGPGTHSLASSLPCLFLSDLQPHGLGSRIHNSGSHNSVSSIDLSPWVLIHKPSASLALTYAHLIYPTSLSNWTWLKEQLFRLPQCLLTQITSSLGFSISKNDNQSLRWDSWECPW